MAAVLLAAVAAGHAAVEVIVVRYRSPSEVLPLAKPLLTPEGRLSADDLSSRLIIVDSEEAIARVRAFLAELDKPVPQATVRVRFEETGAREERSISGSGRVSGDYGSVSAGRSRRSRDGVDVRVEDRSVSRSGGSEYFIQTLSGSWAYIRVGRDVPYSPSWAELCRRHGRSVAFQRIETGFDVRPVLMENSALVDIVPRISQMGSGGGDGVVRFAAAATRVPMPLGQWVAIAGSEQSASEVVRAILEAGRSRQSSSLSVLLMVEAK
jgi:type II secretory pathway component GspD/PulD (secretin)